jgi:hypothetical protein
MSDFDSIWEAAAARMDAAVDTYLGDTILVQMGGGEFDPFVPMKAFVIDVDASQPTDFDPIDEPLGNRKRIKIAKGTMPVVSVNHRIKHPRLGEGVYRPSGALPENQGRYWLFDVQKV